MTRGVKLFIEHHKLYILHESWDELYDEAYEWLHDEQVSELTNILAQSLNIPAEEYAKSNIMKHFLIELTNFKAEKQHQELTLPSFIRMYMNHTNGIKYVDFAEMVSSELESNTALGVIADLDSDLDIILRKRK